MINITTLITAVRTRLTGDVTLAALVTGVWHGVIPATVTWAKPAIEIGLQAETRDAAGYGTDASDVVLRLMVHGRGSDPGVGNFDAVLAALHRADLALTTLPLTVSGHQVYTFRRSGSVPPAAEADAQGYLRMSAGNLYRVRLLVTA